ncbi:VOC family protein [Curtobacterium pusillum]|uniref:VOC family protein n=1 Tax=Curtobacterium pusillum TaxID=69373 RepID=A0ABX2M8Z5_9MICO|nr:VOC family protein [Curtobacterium pusillum]NUU14522.1 VOC family protein [Curtobacterium pusillum]GLK30890.1 lyase [Curtobacterium pusillum]
MTIQISGVHVLADDIDAAVAFYGDVLGFTVRNTVENGGFRWVTLVSDDHAYLELVLSEPHAGRSQEDGDAIAALLAKGGLSMLQLRVSDLDATFDRITASADAEVLQEPTDQFWGVRDAAVRDPAGNMVRIAQA